MNINPKNNASKNKQGLPFYSQSINSLLNSEIERVFYISFFGYKQEQIKLIRN